MTVATGDWADHYSQTAIYLRMNGQLPPTAKRRGPVLMGVAIGVRG
jgi:hypothetical protein